MTGGIGSFLNTNVYLPDDEDSNRIYLTNLLIATARTVNSKEIAIYDIREVITGQAWFNNNSPQNLRGGYRKVVQFPSLTAIGTTSIAHGLGNITGFTFTRVMGTARNAAGTLHVALPQGGPDDVMITVDANNVNIICATATYNTFSAQVILEYLKN